MLPFAAGLAATLIATQPAPAPSVGELRQGLAGSWTGALGYRDYQSNRLFELPVATTIAAVPDGETQVRTSRFDEGAGQAPVWITSVSRARPGGEVETATFRVGRPVEVQAERTMLTRYISPTRWTIIYSQTGTDDDQPAEIRVTETRDGDDLLSVKDVRPAGDASAEWRFRNQTRLRRVP